MNTAVRTPRPGWFTTPEPEHRVIHVHPEDDLRPHILIGNTCWCRPRRDEVAMVHNSLDQREQFEQGRKPS